MRVSALLLLLAGCMAPAEPTREELYQAICLDDGVDVDEAGLIASEYFHWFISGCGVVGTPEQVDGCWRTKAFVGYVGVPQTYPIWVAPDTGASWWASGPAVADPFQIEAAAAAHRGNFDTEEMEPLTEDPMAPPAARRRPR